MFPMDGAEEGKERLGLDLLYAVWSIVHTLGRARGRVDSWLPANDLMVQAEDGGSEVSEDERVREQTEAD